MVPAMMIPTRFSLLLLAVAAAWPLSGSAQDTIDELVEQAGLREGPVAMRDVDGWDPSRRIVLRDIGLDASLLEERFGGADIVLAGSVDDAREHVAGAGALIGYCSSSLLAEGSYVRWVQIYSAGAERCLAVEEARRDDVVLTNMQKMSSPVIAEHAIAMLLALTRDLREFTSSMESGEWRRGWRYTNEMTTVAGKTMLVLGLGGIGTEIARRGAALGMRVTATRNRSREGPDFVDYVGLSTEMRGLARNADVIVNALPLTDQTRGLLGAEFFAGLEAEPYFINVGRGATVDTDALLTALREHRLAGAGLDVTDPEPLPPDHALWRESNVIITPHVSSRGGDAARHRLLVLENIRRYLAGDALLNVVDPERGY